MAGFHCIKCLSSELQPVFQTLTRCVFKRKASFCIPALYRIHKQDIHSVNQKHYTVLSVINTKCSSSMKRLPVLQGTTPLYQSASRLQFGPPEQLETDTNNKRVGITRLEQKKMVKMKPQQPLNPRILKVSIIGAPNAGKSTLANQLTGWRFASVSKKVHTTRYNAVGVLTYDNTQVVFLDTPGLITQDKVKKHHLEKSLLTDPHSSLFVADLIITVVDISQPWNRSRLNQDVLTALMMHSQKKSILVLNKVDLLKCKSDLLTTARLLTEGVIGGKAAPHFKTVKKRDNKKDNIDILEKILEKEKKLNSKTEIPSLDEASEGTEAAYVYDPSDENWWNSYSKKLKPMKRLAMDKRGWEKFDRVFMISAIDGDGVDDIKQYLIESAVPGPWLYHSDVVTDQDPIELIKFCIREKILDHLPQEIPYKIEIHVRQWEPDENNYLRACVDLLCPRSRDLVHLLGKNGQTIKKIREDAQQELMNIFQQELSLYLSAYVGPKSQDF